MYGAILGDIIGSPYEFDRGDKVKTFPLFSAKSKFTDDSVMTIAIAETLLQADKEESPYKSVAVRKLKKWGNNYPGAGYGGRFRRWLFSDNTEPYNSFGNGAAMRISPVGLAFEALDETLDVAKWVTEVTHNHPDGIKGAQATVTAMFLARHGFDKRRIKDYIEDEFKYDLSRSCDEIRPGYHHVESCQETVPEAITAFLEGTSFEDVIRTAVSLGGDCDTLTAIAGGIAEAYYGVPEELKAKVLTYLPDDMTEVLSSFYAAHS